VAAWGASSDYWDGEARGDRHLYSSVGPRIDGGKTVDLAAPADPFVPAPLAEVAEDSPNDPPYSLFSGTSGAGPHVAAAAVLLRQLSPDADGEELRQSLRDGARVDPFVAADADTFPDDAWGYGKLSAHGSAYGEAPTAAPTAPVQVEVELTAFWDGDERCAVTGVATVAGHPDAPVRWDLGYDGEWDTGFQPEPVEFELEPDEVTVVRAQASARGWWVGGQAVVFHAPDPCPRRGCTGCRSGLTDGGTPGLVMLGILAAIRRRRRS
jgi:MYXO-CTERM domain-containing protein